MGLKTSGIHHITAFVRDAQRNVDFYAGVLGLRLVKKTVNYDAPEVYHLYFGNQSGTPGTIITFFPWAHSRKGRVGAGQVGITVYAVPTGSLPYWEQRLNRFGVAFTKEQRFNEQYLHFEDPDGLQLELVERAEGATNLWAFDDIPAEYAIKGFGGAVLFSYHPQLTADTLTRVMGLEAAGDDGERMRFRAHGDMGQIIDVHRTVTEAGHGGAGTVHHIAWRATDEAEHEQWRTQVTEYGLVPTPIVDRRYFKAVYFREGGGILYEIATDPPGFDYDEPSETMGEKIMLPPWLEGQREELEQNLVPISVRPLKEGTNFDTDTK